jgi:hypothetical protein
VSDEQPQPDLEQAPGWVVTDPDGNVVDSGPLTEAQAAFLIGEASTEGEQ